MKALRTEGPILPAKDIAFKKIFSPGEEDNGIPHNESLEWLLQYTHGKDTPEALPPDRCYLLVGDETAPQEIWESTTTDPQKRNSVFGNFQRIWRDPELQEWDVTIKATVTKVIRVTAATEEEANETASQMFTSEREEGTDEKYEEDVLETTPVQS